MYKNESCKVHKNDNDRVEAFGQDIFNISSFHDFRVHTTIANLGDLAIPEFEPADPLRYLAWVAGEGPAESEDLLGESRGLHEDIHIDGSGSHDLELMWQRHLARRSADGIVVNPIREDRSDTPRDVSDRSNTREENRRNEEDNSEGFRKRRKAKNARTPAWSTEPPLTTQQIKENCGKWLDFQWRSLAMNRLYEVCRDQKHITSDDYTSIMHMWEGIWKVTSDFRLPEFNHYYTWAILAIAFKYEIDWFPYNRNDRDAQTRDILPTNYDTKYIQDVNHAEREILKFIDYRLEDFSLHL